MNTNTRQLSRVLLFFTSLMVLSPAQAGLIVDVVGGTSSPATGTALAKGNSYRVDSTVVLHEFETYLVFSDTQTLNFYLYGSASEFGTYSLINATNSAVAGSGAGFYSSGNLNETLTAGNWYILATSWSGDVDYFFDIEDAVDTSFGAYVHGFAKGLHPLGATIDSPVNDQAVYYQRISTTAPVPAPATFALLGIGFAGLGWSRRKRTNNA